MLLGPDWGSPRGEGWLNPGGACRGDEAEGESGCRGTGDGVKPGADCRRDKDWAESGETLQGEDFLGMEDGTRPSECCEGEKDGTGLREDCRVDEDWLDWA